MKCNDWLDNEDISMLLMLVSSSNKVFDNYKNGREYQEQLKETLIRMRCNHADGYPKNDIFKAWK